MKSSESNTEWGDENEIEVMKVDDDGNHSETLGDEVVSRSGFSGERGRSSDAFNRKHYPWLLEIRSKADPPDIN